MVTVTIPLRLPSVANLREHWAKKAKRAKQHRGLAEMFTRNALGSRVLVYPSMSHRVTVTITRVAPRSLDADNCVSACKAARDGVADALDVDDGDERVTWQYAQRKGERALEIRIETWGEK